YLFVKNQLKMRLFFIIILFCTIGNSQIIDAQYPELYQLNQGLVLHYLFDKDNFDDISGNKNHLIERKIKCDSSVNGTQDGSFIFGGERLKGQFSKPVYSPEYSVSFWFKPEKTLNSLTRYQYFIDWSGKPESKTNDLFTIYYHAGELLIGINYVNQQKVVLQRNAYLKQDFNAGEWYFINFSFTEKGKLWITANETTYPVEMKFEPNEKFANLYNPIYIGAWGVAPEEKLSNPITGNGFYGAMDDVRIYNRILTEKELARLYYEKGEEFTPAEIDILEPLNEEIKVTNENFKLKARVVSATELSKYLVYVNEKLIRQVVKFRHPNKAANGYPYLFENEIGLKEGVNKIKVFAYNYENDGVAESDEKIINYVPIKNTTSNSPSVVNPSDIEIPNFNEKRKALVIGNADYESSAKLRNPVNDAMAMAAELKKLGFEVVQIENGNRKQILEAISDYSTELAKDKNTTGLFYYAGHGIQAKGKNYLIPIDAKIVKEADIQVSCIDLDNLMVYLEEAANNMNLIILDACRNNPYSRSFRSTVGNGLATVAKQPKGTFLAYATAPGTVAADGTGENGLYTAELIKALEIPKLKLEDVFKRVRANVSEKSQDQQIPWDNSSLVGDFYFKKK
ncbi:MAG: caspase family protein, partial [Bacteroidota bacterium]